MILGRRRVIEMSQKTSKKDKKWANRHNWKRNKGEKHWWEKKESD